MSLCVVEEVINASAHVVDVGCGHCCSNGTNCCLHGAVDSACIIQERPEEFLYPYFIFFR